MKLICRNCGYSREKWKEYEDYECMVCHQLMNEDKEEFFDSFGGDTVGMDKVIEDKKLQSIRNDIEVLGKGVTLKNIEFISNCGRRLEYRKLYYKVLEEMDINNI